MHEDYQQQDWDTNNSVPVSTISRQKMTRGSAYALFEAMYDPLSKKHVASNPEYRLLKGFQYTQWCIHFAKNWLWANTDAIKSFNQWEKINTKCYSDCTNVADDGDKRCMLCHFWDALYPTTDNVYAWNFDAVNHAAHMQNYNESNHKRTSMYEVMSVQKLNQVFLHMNCYGRIVRGTRVRANTGVAGDPVFSNDALNDWRVVFTNPNVSNMEQVDSYYDHYDNARINVAETRGAESNDIYMRKTGKYFLDDDNVWKEFEDGSVKKSGLAVESSHLRSLGQFGGARCRCPSGNVYNVGALIDDVSNTSDANLGEFELDRSYHQSCVGGVMTYDVNLVRYDTDHSGSPINVHDLKAVQCDVNGWDLNPELVQYECNHSDPAVVAQCENAQYLAAKDNRSTGYLYMSIQEWNEFKSYKDLAKNVSPPCMFAHYRWASTQQDLSQKQPTWWYDHDYTIDPEHTENLYYSGVEEHMQRFDGMMNQCHTVTTTDLCDWSKSWGTDIFTNFQDDTRKTAMSTYQTQYKAYVQAVCDNEFGSAACTDAKLSEMCQNAHEAEIRLDKLAVLGVGCPLPQDIYVPEPPKPCWYFTGEAGCPDPATEECDKIIRTMHQITKTVGLTVEMGTCFSTDLTATDVTHTLKYHCISKGIMETAGYDDSHITSESYLTNPNYKRYYRKLMGEAEYDNVDAPAGTVQADYNPGKPAYLHKVRATLKKLKHEGEMSAEMDWWNALKGVYNEQVPDTYLGPQ